MLKINALEKRKKLKTLLERHGLVAMPVAIDALSAIMVEKAGFPAVALGGYPTSGTLLGLPDIGLLTMSEVVDSCRRVANITSVPICIDADTGYGGIPNVMRTVRELENAGASAIVLEDQVWPKRCGHMQGKQVVSSEEFIARITTAIETRVDENLVVIARTDSRGVVSYEEAIHRANAALDAGADIAFIEAPHSLQELAEIPKKVKGNLLVNMLHGGKTPVVSEAELEKMGYKLLVYPTAILFNYVKQCQTLLSQLEKTRDASNLQAQMISFDEYTELVGLSKYRQMEARVVAVPVQKPKPF